MKLSLFIEMLFQPRQLVLTQDQAEYVESLFLSGSTPEAIGRAMSATYGPEAFPYFKIPNEDGKHLEFGPRDWEIDGLEFIRAAMVKLGAIKVRKHSDYYQTAHRMVRHLAGIAANAPLPEKKGADNGPTA